MTWATPADERRLTRPSDTPAGGGAQDSGAPPWRVRLLLVALVVLAHIAVLGLSPLPFGLSASDAAAPAPALSIRRIYPAPVSQTAPVPGPLAKPRPISKPKPPPKPRPEPPQPPGQAAAEPAAQPEPEPDPVALLTPEVSTPEAASPMATASAPAEAAASAPAPLAQAPASAAAQPPLPTPTVVASVALPRSVRLAYWMEGQARGLTYHASAELNWRNGGTEYEAFMRVSALFLGSRSMRSTGLLGPGGTAPIRFTDKSRSEVAAHFEAAKGQVTFSANTPSAPWVEGAQDRVTVFMQLGGMLAADPAAFPPGTAVSMYTVGPRSADMWTFQVEAEELLRLPYGELAAVKVIRQPRREYDQRVEIWYAPSLGWLPVRNRITQSNGDFVDQQLTGLE